ncbi:unnamed protein product [Tenebrio molitor]|nr:unnamed protein product [Tenebrio molitor]
MKLISAVIFCAFAVAALAAENKYTNKYDNVDVDKILNNDRVLTNYIKCLMDEGPCTSEGREFQKPYRTRSTAVVPNATKNKKRQQRKSSGTCRKNEPEIGNVSPRSTTLTVSSRSATRNTWPRLPKPAS